MLDNSSCMLHSIILEKKKNIFIAQHSMLKFLDSDFYDQTIVVRIRQKKRHFYPTDPASLAPIPKISSGKSKVRNIWGKMAPCIFTKGIIFRKKAEQKSFSTLSETGAKERLKYMYQCILQKVKLNTVTKFSIKYIQRYIEGRICRVPLICDRNVIIGLNNA